MSEVEVCPGCGLELEPTEGPSHPYIGASPACWALFGELLAREYGELRYPDVHSLTVDAYAVQHPGVPGRRSIQSVCSHLVGLQLVLERGFEPQAATGARARAISLDPGFRWLEPPPHRGAVTVRDVLEARGPAEHAQAVERWARSVWEAWSAHHELVRGWAALVAGG